MVVCLPMESRTIRHQNNDRLNPDQHIQYDIMDLLLQIYFQTSISAAVAAKKEYRSIMQDRPEPMERPVIKKEPIKFATAAELMGMFGGG